MGVQSPNLDPTRIRMLLCGRRIDLCANQRMEFLLRSLEHLPREALGGIITIGNFDGVHEGHRQLIQQLCELASQMQRPAIVFTFDPHPAQLLRPNSAPTPLTWMERRASILKELGVDYVVVCPTTLELLALTPTEFFETILVARFQAGGLVEGPNFRFGHDRQGDISLLGLLCRNADVALRVLHPTVDQDGWISSSRIRNYIEDGDIETANRWLVEPYRVRGIVAHGAARGRTLGFPTANLSEIPNLLPAHGVYAARVVSDFAAQGSARGDAAGKLAAVNIGPNPTFHEGATKVEAHLLDFDGDLYDHSLEIELLARLRSVIGFASKEALLEQLAIDIHDVRRWQLT